MIKKFILIYSIFIIILLTSSCASVLDKPRSWWGSSVRTLNEERKTAQNATFECSMDQCFDAVLAMTQTYQEHVQKVAESEKKITDEVMVRFMVNRTKRWIVVMNVPGAVDTTEVGIFFTQLFGGQVRVEISSLSSLAKGIVAEGVFANLNRKYAVPGGS